MATSRGSGEQFEVSGRKQKHEQSVASNVGEDDSTTAITRGTKAMSIGKVGVNTTHQTDSDAIYTTATLKHSLDVSRETDDEPCELRGVVILQDKIVVTDKANAKLKVFDLAFNFIFDYKCYKYPYDIAMLNTTTIVVTFENHNMRLFSVQDGVIKETRTIDTEYNSLGVCCYGGNIFCVIKDDFRSERFSQVRMYSPEGLLKRRYEYLSDGKVECYDLVRITVNPQTGILYVTDWMHGVLALSTSGDVVAVISAPQLNWSQIKNPVGIDVDGHGQIYVCGLNSHNLIQISADGYNVVELLSNTIRCKKPNVVRIYGNKMFLCRRNSNIISVYELS